MDIIIVTSDPLTVSAEEIVRSIEEADYWVNSIRIEDRNGTLHTQIGVPL